MANVGSNHITLRVGPRVFQAALRYGHCGEIFLGVQGVFPGDAFDEQ